MAPALLIVNPRSGGGRAGAAFGELRPIILRTLGTVDVELTRRSGHAIELARAAAAAGRGLVVAVGGDGTLHEVVNGVMHAREQGHAVTAVGLIGQGTGGDFARTLGLRHNLESYLHALGRREMRSIDVGRVRYRDGSGKEAQRYFVNIVSAGMSGLVDRYVADASRAGGGKAAYFAASLRALARCRPARVRCTHEHGGARRDAVRASPYLIAVCNGRYFGAGMHVAPMAKIDDGRLEVIAMSAANKLAFALAARKIYDGGHLAAPGVRHFACDRIRLELEDEDARDVFLLDVDGEPLGGLPIEVDIVPGALKLVCKPAA
jgi:diacylglycerol kinase (ATP)